MGPVLDRHRVLLVASFGVAADQVGDPADVADVVPGNRLEVHEEEFQLQSVATLVVGLNAPGLCD